MMRDSRPKHLPLAPDDSPSELVPLLIFISSSWTVQDQQAPRTESSSVWSIFSVVGSFPTWNGGWLWVRARCLVRAAQFLAL